MMEGTRIVTKVQKHTKVEQDHMYVTVCYMFRGFYSLLVDQSVVKPVLTVILVNRDIKLQQF